jgi:hypothetical protein
MTRGEEKQAELQRVVDSILATGTAMWTVIEMFASALDRNKFHEEAELVRDVALVSRENS